MNPDGPAALVRPLGHEVGNLLAGIRLAASLLEREALGENVELARDLANSTVSNHIAHIREKLGAESVGDILLYAHRVGIME